MVIDSHVCVYCKKDKTLNMTQKILLELRERIYTHLTS